MQNILLTAKGALKLGMLLLASYSDEIYLSQLTSYQQRTLAWLAHTPHVL